MNCGTTLPLAPQPDRPSPAALVRTPKHIAERVLRTRQTIEGERKSVTVLFADIKGSTGLVEHRDPDDARLLLEPVLQAMIDAVHRFDGVVSKVMGDGLMALFGAPLALEDHAIRASYAALAMRQAVRGRSAELRISCGVEVQVRIGINSGEVIVLGIGDDLHMDYDAIGATVHLAARMEQAAVPDTIWLSSYTAGLLRARMTLDDLGLVSVPGFSQPVGVFELVEATEIELRSERSIATTPIIGRDAELHILNNVATRVTSGRGQTVILTGEPGIGKSRFCAEVSRQLGAGGWLCLTTRAAPYEGGEPWLAIRRMLRSYFAAADDTDMARQVQESIRCCDAALTAAVPAILEIMGLQLSDHPAWRALEPADRRQRIFDACSGWLIAESRTRPVLMVADDLQWTDAETVTLLHSIAGVVGHVTILLILVARPDHLPRQTAFESATQIRLQPLEPIESAKLLDELTGASTHLTEIRTRLIERAGGNPLYLNEIVRVLNDTGSVLAEALPPTVQAIIAARIDDLQTDEKRLLQTAAVVGQEFDLAHLVDTVAGEEGEVRAALARLQLKGFLQERTIFPGISFGFDQPLVLEVAYRSLVNQKRCELHRRAFAALKKRDSESCEILVGRLAHHAYESELWDEAARFCRLAARRAAAQSGYQEAAALYRKALFAVAQTPETIDRSRQEVDLCIELRHVLFPIGQFVEIGTLLDQALKAAEAAGDRGRIGLVLTHSTTHHLGAGRHREAVDIGIRALAIAEELKDEATARNVLFHLVQASASCGNYRSAVDFCRRLIENPPEGATGLTTTSLARMWLAWCLAELGAFGEAHNEVEAAFEAARGTDQSLPVLLAYLGRGLTNLREQRFEEAAMWLEVALPMSEPAALRAWWGAIGSPLGRAWAALGRSKEAVALLEQVVAHTTSSRGSGHVLRWVHLAEAYLLEGRADEATQIGTDALERARHHGERGHEAYALVLLGQLAEIGGSRADAISYWQAAGEISVDLEMKPLQAQVQRLLAASPEFPQAE